MGKFALKKKISLDFVGDAWADCYLEFNDLTMRELQDLTQLDTPDVTDKEAIKKEYDRTINFLSKQFVSGKALGKDGKVIDVTKDDIGELSATITKRAMRFLAGG